MAARTEDDDPLQLPPSLDIGGDTQGLHGYDADFTAEEEELLVALLNRYNGQLNGREAGSTVNDGATVGIGGLGDLAHADHGLPAVREHERLASTNNHFSGPSRQQQQNFRYFPSSQRSEGGSGGGLQSLLSFASSAALDELLDNAVFPTDVQLPAVPVPEQTSDLQVREGGPASTPPADGWGAGPSDEVPKAAGPAKSPLARWRSFKPLSVTDLVSPAWCELQYSLALSRHGRVKKTGAMKQGSARHKKLEEEVHTTFQVSVTSREDAWALRLWNVIQGARTLRATGLTRELGVWGVVQGQLVAGVIDHVGYECPDEDLERQAAQERDETAAEGGQRPIEEFFQGRISGRRVQQSSSRDGSPKVYITDFKTRTVRSLPKGSSFRSTEMQLMLYHRLLGELAAGSFDPQRLWQEYKLDAEISFSESFVAQFASEDTQSDSEMSDSAMYLSQQDAQPRGPWTQQQPPSSLPSTQRTGDSPELPTTVSNSTSSGHQGVDASTQASGPVQLTESFDDLHTLLLRYNSLRQLWDVMLAELTAAIPDGLGSVLTAEYHTRGDTWEVLGSKSIIHDDAKLDDYLERTLQWWKGQREPKGVEVDEAWKCASCEFAGDCEWRKQKVDGATARFREKNAATAAAATGRKKKS